MVEDHVYEAAVRGRREMRQAYREARAARGEDRTLTAIHARADLRFLLGWFFILAGVAQWFGFCALVVWRVCA